MTKKNNIDNKNIRLPKSQDELEKFFSSIDNKVLLDAIRTLINNDNKEK